MAYVSDPQANSQTEKWNQGWANEGKCRVQFHRMTVIDERESWGWTEEREVLNDDGSIRIEKKRFPGKGRPIFKEVDFIKKFTPGDATNIVDREVWPIDKEEYAREWEAYQAGREQLSGSPLELLPGLAPSRIEEFKNFPKTPVRTVEELANLSDTIVQVFMCNAERDQARRWLQMMERNAPVALIEAEIAKRDEENAQLKARIAALETLARSNRAAEPEEPEVAEEAAEPAAEPVVERVPPGVRGPSIRRKPGR